MGQAYPMGYNPTVDIGDSVPRGRIAHLAPQQELGSLSERWAWTGRPDPDRIDPHWSDLQDNHGAERQRTQPPPWQAAARSSPH